MKYLSTDPSPLGSLWGVSLSQSLASDLRAEIICHVVQIHVCDWLTHLKLTNKEKENVGTKFEVQFVLRCLLLVLSIFVLLNRCFTNLSQKSSFISVKSYLAVVIFV